LIKLNAKFGVAAIVAALFVAFGAFGFGATSTSAGALPPILVGVGPCTPGGGTPGAAVPASGVASGTVLCVRAPFSAVGNSLTVTQNLTNVTASTLTLTRAVAINTIVVATVVDISPWAGDDDATANVYQQSAATQNSYSLIPIPVTHSLAYDLTTTVTCSTENAASGTISFTAVQLGGNGVNNAAGSTSASVTCNTPKSNTISIAKIDQNGAKVAAQFAVQVETPIGSANWQTIATMNTSATGTNPCLSTNAACTFNPSTIVAGVLPAQITAVAPAIPGGQAIRIIEVAQNNLCTLVQIRDGGGVLLVQPVTIADVSTASLASRTLTFVNSCAIAGNASSSGSSIAVVVGGATYGLSNSTHVEIIPALGSDDDARLDIRARDQFNVPLVGAHVTLSVDKGTIAMRTDTSGGVVLSGYEVIEPSAPAFGSNTSGDTCDQVINQFNANVYNGANTNPFISTSRTIQDSYTNTDGMLSACLYVNPDMSPGITPGKITVTAIIERPGTGLYDPYGSANLIVTATVTVVGPPASIKVAASPTSVQCGEKSTITATVTDSVGQNVSDHTRVELVSNFGATIGGTGATLGFPGVGAVNPLSSSAAETFSGVATAFLLTSTEHVGPYEVVVASGGSVGGVQTQNLTNGFGQTSFQSGVFSTAPVSAQVTVTCALPVVAAPVAAAPIAAPRTGEGIRPPNTGDAGLAADNSSLVFVLAGAVAFALAGVASVKFARR